MDFLRRKQMKPARGFLDDQFLIAMPGMKDDRFARAVIYVCAHSEEGAMGLIINQAQQMLFPDLLVQLGIMDEQEAIRLPPQDARFRGAQRRPGRPQPGLRPAFGRLHGGIFAAVSDDICLTATVDILRAISAGRGPRHALMALGYSGWGAGQLETEIAENGWLTCPADAGLLFDADIERKYDRILASIGIDLAHLSLAARHAGPHHRGLRLVQRILLPQRLQRLVARHRRAEHEALHIFAAHLSQLQRVVLVGDALGHHRQPELVRHVDHRLDEHRALGRDSSTKLLSILIVSKGKRVR